METRDLVRVASMLQKFVAQDPMMPAEPVAVEDGVPSFMVSLEGNLAKVVIQSPPPPAPFRGSTAQEAGALELTDEVKGQLRVPLFPDPISPSTEKTVRLHRFYVAMALKELRMFKGAYDDIQGEFSTFTASSVAEAMWDKVREHILENRAWAEAAALFFSHADTREFEAEFETAIHLDEPAKPKT